MLRAHHISNSRRHQTAKAPATPTLNHHVAESTILAHLRAMPQAPAGYWDGRLPQTGHQSNQIKRPVGAVFPASHWKWLCSLLPAKSRQRMRQAYPFALAPTPGFLCFAVNTFAALLRPQDWPRPATPRPPAPKNVPAVATDTNLLTQT